jgi:dihydrofolate synthase/folylpolyglutamate synthase
MCKKEFEAAIRPNFPLDRGPAAFFHGRTMTYPDAILRLSAARRFGMKLGLEPMRAIAARLGHPENGLRFIHLAGSNGKGSTAAFCESCLRAAGRRVGLYTSPHLVSIRERIQVDRVPISEADFAEGLDRVLAAAEGEPTFFELLTGLALGYFARERVDWIVWETGLGGRLDATNIVRPAVSVITGIALEHTQYLGSTLPEIAREKAGIIKPGVPVVSGATGEAGAVIAEAARESRSPLIEIDSALPAQDLGLREGRQRARLGGNEYTLGLLGSHQVRNAACAVAALRQLAEPISDEAITRGLETASWPGRFQIVSESPLLVLDGAHNQAAMETLLAAWRGCLAARNLDGTQAHLLFGAVADKDISGMAALLAREFKSITLVRLASERSADPRHLAPHFGQARCELLDSLAAWNPPAAHPVLVTGSLFLVGEMLARLSGAGHDLRLNEALEPRADSRGK